MKHDTSIDYPGGLHKLATDLANMRYDSLGKFLKLLSKKINKDAKADKKRKREKLFKQLTYAAKYIENAWKICKPFMK